jgi:hypothetical protein
MGWLSETFSSVSSVVSSIGGAIGAAVSRISPMLGMGIEVVRAVSNVAQFILAAFGYIKPDDKMDDIGDRVLQAGEAGIKPDNFEKFEEYVEAIRNFELDPEKSKKLAEQDKLSASLGFATIALEDRYKDTSTGSIAELWNLVAKNPSFFNPDLIKHILPITQNFQNISDYFEGRLARQDKLEVGEILFEAEKSLSPNKSDSEILDTIDSVKALYHKGE